MSKMYNGFQRRVMEIFYLADVREDLLWHVTDDQLYLSADVSDIFDWASADSEEITPETLPVLEQAYKDLKAVGGEGYLADLYGARMRRRRPQGAAYPESPEIIELLNACGPPREKNLSNPRPAPKRSDVGTEFVQQIDEAADAGDSLVLEIEPEMREQLGQLFGAKTYPYPEGEFLVLGPEVFVNEEADVICWRGENYERQIAPIHNSATSAELRDQYRTVIREVLGEGPWDVVAERCADAVQAVRDEDMTRTEDETERRGRTITRLQGRLRKEQAEPSERAQAAIRELQRQVEKRDLRLGLIRHYLKTSDDDGITTREQALKISGSNGSAHLYFSTGCLHGEHAYCQGETGAVGRKIPAQCKFCGAPCLCSCHEDSPPMEAQPLP
jgi:hypothetical protein